MNVYKVFAVFVCAGALSAVDGFDKKNLGGEFISFSPHPFHVIGLYTVIPLLLAH